eukprot:CAMPEP_0180285268 /NCGR_PEP_ID=MMETSP0988-20121125/11821_1 /TAXON_ID=697907 /ORGANISM="non described non described, Strain CCMP2293" /LENGTH=89 /DNA_ID=CAMNT_0022258661 /DNA_START=127 /DNA_END=396 /DNA_ORIENTATION=-
MRRSRLDRLVKARLPAGPADTAAVRGMDARQAVRPRVDSRVADLRRAAAHFALRAAFACLEVLRAHHLGHRPRQQLEHLVPPQLASSTL